MSMTSSSDFKLIRGSVQIKTLDNQTYNILPVSLTMSLSIQLMINFKFSSGIQSNIVGIYFTLNCMHCRCMRSAANAAPCTFNLHWFNTRELKMDMHIHFELVRVKSMETISIDLTRMSSKWICPFMVEIFYVRWSILDQSLHWDLFMRDIINNVHHIASARQMPIFNSRV